MSTDGEEGAIGLDMADSKVAWVNKLRKEALVVELRQLDLQTDGTVGELRRRLMGHLRTESSKDQPPPSAAQETSSGPLPTPFDFDLLNQIRKLNIVFDGKTDPVSFLERLEQLQEEYGITGQQLLRTLPGLLQGKANLWYRNYRDQWKSFYDFLEDFKTFFFPPDYRDNLEEIISKTYQDRHTTARDFILNMQTMIRRHGGFSTEREITCIYRRLRPEYRQYIRRNDISRITELLREAYEFEQIQQDMDKSDRAKRADRSVGASEMITPAIPRRHETHERSIRDRQPATQAPVHREGTSIRCWRCGNQGHTRFNCQQPPRLFCSRCGRQGIQSRHCRCMVPQENSRGFGQEGSQSNSRS